MSPVPSSHLLAYLDGHTTLNLATSGLVGLWACAVLYVVDDGRLYFTSVESTRHGQNITATGVAAGTINDDCTSWQSMKGIQLEGIVEPVVDVDELTRIVAAYLHRFPFSAALWDGETDPTRIAADPGIHGFFRFTPSRMLFMDNEHSPGQREELTFARR